MTAPSAPAVPDGVVRPLAGPPRGQVRQATFVEMHRAQAEVVAAVMAAREMPRSQNEAVADMRDGCARKAMATKAFYRYSRGGGDKPITGGTIQLARFLALCWQNVQYGITELSRDEHDSQMQAWAWDLQRNTRPTTTFIVPHGRVVGTGEDKRYRELDDPRDIYENNANNGARRVREMIFAVLPPWFTDMAQDICRNTLANGEAGENVQPMPVRIAGVLDAFNKVGVTRRQLEHKQGRGADDWTPEDLAALHVVFMSMRRGETNRDEEFDPDRAPVGAPSAAAAPGGDAATPDDGDADAPAEAPVRPAAAVTPTGPPAVPSSAPQHRNVMRLMRAAQFPSMLSALYVVHTLGAPDTAVRGSLEDYSKTELSRAINVLVGWEKEGPDGDAAALHRHVDNLLPAEADPAWAPYEAARAAHEAAATADGAPAEPGDDNDDPQDD